ASPNDIAGGTPEENARDIVEVLKGKKGAKCDIIAINAGAALLVGEKAQNLNSGIKMAQGAIESGAALDKLRDFVKASGDPSRLEQYL
ncbi:MAG TPA: anthranilate phosphoribosyltransferase, partial [Candidatus Methanoperedens sp.]